MTVRWLLVGALVCAAGACGHRDTSSSTFVRPPHLPPPRPSDPTAFGHAYLETIGARLETDWSAFLEDLRLRLPPTDPLNDGRLVVELDCQIARDGSIGAIHVASSGREAFDRAAVEVLRDAAPVAPPPAELVSDDDTVHLRWTFARDRRQAGVAGARIERVEWPLERAVPKLVAAGELGEAARRIARAAAAERRAPVLLEEADRVFQAAIVEGLGSTDGSVRREAAAAIEATGGASFAAQAHALARTAVDVDVRAHAIGALGTIGTGARDPDAAAILDDLLAQGPELGPSLVAATAHVLAGSGSGDAVARAALGWLAPAPARAPSAAAIAAALAALGEVAAPQAVPAVRRLLAASDPMTRGAACAALAPSTGPTGAGADAWAGIARGLRDPDATVRASCAQASARGGTPAPRDVIARTSALIRDRDERVRGAAAIAVAALDPAHAPALLRAWPREKSAAVRAALATAWGRLPGETPAALLALAGDEDPAVRAAGVAALAARDSDDARALAAKLAPDPDPQVRLAAIPAIATPAGLAGLLTDEDPQVRTAALDRDARLRGRAGALYARATALAAAPPASADRVRIARSWLLAK